jgi:hypothetical protein
MKIYRFLPNARHYAVVTKTLVGQWWPDGIELGGVMRQLFPKGPGRWPHVNNCYNQYPPELPLSDFPAFALNVPVLSERALAALTSARLVSDAVPMTVSGLPFFALQPRVLPDVFDEGNSRGLTLSDGEVFHYYRRSFDVSKVTAEFFVIPKLQPFSDVYVTEQLLGAAEEAGLTGLEYAELVYDEGGPVVPVYPSVAREQIQQYTFRRRLEWELLYGRASFRCYEDEEIRDAVEGAVSAGLISFEYNRPDYRREPPAEALRLVESDRR